MFEVIKKKIKFSNGNVYAAGDVIKPKEFIEEIPDKRKLKKVVKQLIDLGRIKKQK